MQKLASRIVSNKEINQTLVPAVQSAREFVWIATADIKDMQVRHKGKVVSFLSLLNELLKRNVSIRLLHAKEPGEKELVTAIMDQFDTVWMGSFCKVCGRRDYCGDPIL